MTAPSARSGYPSRTNVQILFPRTIFRIFFIFAHCTSKIDVFQFFGGLNNFYTKICPPSTYDEKFLESSVTPVNEIGPSLVLKRPTGVFTNLNTADLQGANQSPWRITAQLVVQKFSSGLNAVLINFNDLKLTPNKSTVVFTSLD